VARFIVEKELKNGWSRWVQPIRRGYKMTCCDCGLVHTMDFRIKDGRAQFRAQRNVRSTAMIRRWKGIKIRRAS
jgi:hypothetical protein